MTSMQELRGLVVAFKAIAKLATDEKNQSHDPIDWVGVQHLAERAALVLMEAEETAERLASKGGA